VATVANVPEALTHCPFTTAEARVRGVTRVALRSGDWRQLFPDVWVHSSVPDTVAMRVEATRLALGQAGFVCSDMQHTTGAGETVAVAVATQDVAVETFVCWLSA
jgi:hypothetical protein